MTTPRWGWLLGVMILKPGRGKGTSLNSTCLTPKPLASCVYVHVPEAPFPRTLAISVMSRFPSLNWKPEMPVVICGVQDGQITTTGMGFQEFESLTAAQKMFPDLDPEKNTERFTWAFGGTKDGKPRLRFETWSAYNLYAS